MYAGDLAFDIENDEKSKKTRGVHICEYTVLNFLGHKVFIIFCGS